MSCACQCDPCQCQPTGLEAASGGPSLFPQGTQLIQIPTAECSSAEAAAASEGSSSESTEPHTPVFGVVRTTFTTVSTIGSQGQFVAYSASEYILPGGWVYFAGLGYLKILSVSGETVTYQLPDQPFGVAVDTKIIADATFAVMPPLEEFPFDVNVTALLNSVCSEEDDCPCTPVGTEFDNLWGCSDGEFKQLKPPGAEELSDGIIISQDGKWKIDSLANLVDFDVLGIVPHVELIEPTLVLDERYDDIGVSGAAVLHSGEGGPNPVEGNLKSGTLPLQTVLEGLSIDPNKVSGVYLGLSVSATTENSGGELYMDINGVRAVAARYSGAFGSSNDRVFVFLPFTASSPLSYAWGWNRIVSIAANYGAPDNPSTDPVNGISVYLYGYLTKGQT